jgi:glycosyltransferase involved in cell wall biosynthesis
MKLSLILPIYNEIKNLQKGVLDKVINYAKDNNQIAEILVVDDGSTDESVKIIKTEYLGHYPKIRLVEKNHSGKAFTLIAGIKQAQGTHVLFSDIDLATPIEETDKFITEIGNHYDVLIGSRSNKREGAPLTRKIMSLGSMIVKDLILNLQGLHDTQCGFKAFDRQKALQIINKLQVFKTESQIKGSSVAAGFDLEFLFLAKRMNFKIKEIPVVWRHVETKNVNFFKDSYEAMRDIIKIKLFDLFKKYN